MRSGNAKTTNHPSSSHSFRQSGTVRYVFNETHVIFTVFDIIKHTAYYVFFYIGDYPSCILLVEFAG